MAVAVAEFSMIALDIDSLEQALELAKDGGTERSKSGRS